MPDLEEHIAALESDWAVSPSLTSKPGCPFCARIAAGEYSIGNGASAAFEPLNPVVPGHLLVVPKVHVADAFEDPAVTAITMRAAAAIARDQCSSANLITSIGAAATQTIRHLHIHVIPRREGDGLHLPWTGQHA